MGVMSFEWQQLSQRRSRPEVEVFPELPCAWKRRSFWSRSKIESDQQFRVFLPPSSQVVADTKHMLSGLLRLVCVVSGKSLAQINVQIWQGKCTSRTSTVWARSASSTLGSCPTPSWLMSSMRNSRWVFGFPLWLLGGTTGWAKESFNNKITIIKLNRWLTLS